MSLPDIPNLLIFCEEFDTSTHPWKEAPYV